MTGANFTERWLQKQRDLGLEEMFDGFVVNGSDVLPASAAPCLTFNNLRDMPRVEEVFLLEGLPRAVFARMRPYRMIGSDGAGNPICIEQATREIWLLDHEDWFETKQYMNSSIPQLAESLLAYAGQDDSAKFVAALIALDARAMVEGAFWWHEAKTL
jgi:hypothetical protein